MSRKKLQELSTDPFVLAMDQADDLKPIPAEFAAGWLSVSETILGEWRSAGRTPPQFIKITDKKVVYPMGELRRFMREALEEALATNAERRSAAPLSATKPTSAAEQMAKITGAKDLSHLGLDDEILRGGRRKGVRHASFSQFMARGAAEDEWVFALIPGRYGGAYRRPVDLIETLYMSEEEIGDASCEQLSQAAYLERLQIYLSAAPGQTEAGERHAAVKAMDTSHMKSRPPVRS